MGIVAAAVVGEVLLRGGEAGSAVPTKVPGNLERTVCVCGGAPVSVAGSHPFWGVPRAPQNTGQAQGHRGKATSLLTWLPGSWQREEENKGK